MEEIDYICMVSKCAESELKTNSNCFCKIKNDVLIYESVNNESDFLTESALEELNLL